MQAALNNVVGGETAQFVVSPWFSMLKCCLPMPKKNLQVIAKRFYFLVQISDFIPPDQFLTIF